MLPHKRVPPRLKIILFILIIMMALFEIICAACLSFPSLLGHGPRAFLHHVRGLYLSLDRKIIQYEPGWCQYDPRLGYLAKPGQFIFSAREFQTLYVINNLGVRDDKQSLKAQRLLSLATQSRWGGVFIKIEPFHNLFKKKLGRPS